MHDIKDIIKNLQTLTENSNSFKVLKDFERVIDQLDLYVFENWADGELVEGPVVGRYDVKCKFMWPKNNMPNPSGGKRLTEYGCQVSFKKDNILVPRKIRDPGDFRPGTKKGKIDAHPVWIVEITMPKKLMQDVYVGKENQDNNKLAELMRYKIPQATAETAAQETGQDDTQQTA